jgi:glycosyltransferase involved in cell wall biosynthesis
MCAFRAQAVEGWCRIMNLPLVSVIIPVYNGEAFLAEAIESIRWQNYEPLEIIIVNDGSFDRTAEVVQGLGEDICFLSQENRGPGSARNRALEVARGEFFAFLDADDQWPRNKLHLQVRYLLNHPEHDLVTGRIQIVQLPGAAAVRWQVEGPENTLSHVNLGAAVCRKRVFERVGRFDETLRIGEDQDWFLRLREQRIPIIILEETTLQYRQHGNNMTRDCKLPDFRLTQIFKSSLERRRRQNGGKAEELARWFDGDQKPRAGMATIADAKRNSPKG